MEAKRSEKREARNEKREARNEKRGARSDKREARREKREARDDKRSEPPYLRHTLTGIKQEPESALRRCVALGRRLLVPF